MRVVIRADGGGSVGWGHLSRCAALAEVLSEADVTVDWACRAEPAVQQLTGTTPALTLSGPPTLGDLPASEAQVVSAFAAGADWIIVDHYGADTGYLEGLRSQSSARVLLFEDHQVRGGADPDRNNFSMKWVGLTGILAAVMLANSLDRKQEQEDELAESLGRARLPDGAEKVLPDGRVLMADGSIRR